MTHETGPMMEESVSRGSDQKSEHITAIRFGIYTWTSVLLYILTLTNYVYETLYMLEIAFCLPKPTAIVSLVENYETTFLEKFTCVNSLV